MHKLLADFDDRRAIAVGAALLLTAAVLAVILIAQIPAQAQSKRLMDITPISPTRPSR
jgi:hypothetical protein